MAPSIAKEGEMPHSAAANPPNAAPNANITDHVLVDNVFAVPNALGETISGNIAGSRPGEEMMNENLLNPCEENIDIQKMQKQQSLIHNTNQKLNIVQKKKEIATYRGIKTISPLENATLDKAFGEYVDPVYNINIFNESVTLKVQKELNKVLSVFDGKVVFAGKSKILGITTRIKDEVEQIVSISSDGYVRIWDINENLNLSNFFPMFHFRIFFLKVIQPSIC